MKIYENFCEASPRKTFFLRVTIMIMKMSCNQRNYFVKMQRFSAFSNKSEKYPRQFHQT